MRTIDSKRRLGKSLDSGPAAVRGHLSSTLPRIARRLNSVNVALSFWNDPRPKISGELAYIMVKRISGAVETEDQCAGGGAYGDPVAFMFGKPKLRGASKARAHGGAANVPSRSEYGGCAGQSVGSHRGGMREWRRLVDGGL